MPKLRLTVIVLVVIFLLFGTLHLYNVANDSKYKKALLLSAHSLGYTETKLLSLDTNDGGMNYNKLEILYTTDLSLDQFTSLVNGAGYKIREYFNTKVDNFFPGPKTTRRVTNDLKVSDSSYPQNTEWVIIDHLTGHQINVEYFELTSGSWIYNDQKIEENLVLLSIDKM